MRPVRTLTVVLVLALAAAACSNTDDTEPASTTASDTSTAASTDATTTSSADAESTTTSVHAESTDPLVIATSLGPVRGVAEDEVRRWTNIPFAAAPTGENRWRAPQPHEGWAEEVDATTQGLMCPQPGGNVTTDFLVSPDQTEDCLTLSVWSPEDAEALPVMVWIHGGGLTSGSAHQLLYESTDLASEGAVIVPINYRLGALGFLAHPDAATEDPEGRTGNYGLMDQQYALEWVQENIESFGGDPDNVTLFGESAGGFSICGHLASPASEGLFHKAVIQSGGGCLGLQALDEANAAADEYVASTSCADDAGPLACLRALPADETAVESQPSNLVADGVLLDTPAVELAAAGQLNGIPIITGSNQDESTLFTLGVEEPTDDEFAEAVSERAGDAAADILPLYATDEFTTNLERLQAVQNEFTFTCTAESFAQTLAGAGGMAYRYYFSYVPDPDPIGLGATHGAELVFLFANPEGIAVLPEGDLAEADAAVSESMQTAWVSFATDGAPTAPVDWTPTNASAPSIAQIDTDWSNQTEIRNGRCTPIIPTFTE